jgi:hypothetical protein
MPEGTLSLAPRPGSLVRLTFQKWSAWLLLAKSQRGEGLDNLLPPGVPRGLGAVFLEKESFRENEQLAKPLGQETVIAPVHDGSTIHVSFLLNGPRGRTCTCNLSGLSGTPLHWATRGSLRTATPRSDLHRHCARFKCAVSALDYVGCWCRAAKLVPREGFGFPRPPQNGCPKLGFSLSRIVVHPGGSPPGPSPF